MSEQSDGRQRSGRRAAHPAAHRVRSQTTRHPRGARVRVAATILVVPAIFGTVALPAYALHSSDAGHTATASFSLTKSEAQTLDVSTLATRKAVSDDSYEATTKDEIEAAEAAAAEAQAAAWATALASRASDDYARLTVQSPGDDYPWWRETPDDYGGGLSPLGYYYRECVDFVAWRLNRDAGATGTWRYTWATMGVGSAWSWADGWARNGWPTSSEPVVGAVAWFPSNHVAYVNSINADGSVNLEEYNWGSDHQYHSRTIAASDALYLYPPG